MKKHFLILCISLIYIIILPAQESDPLQQAYQREFVYLDNEIRLLEERIGEVSEEGETRISAAQEELSSLELELIRLQEEVSRRNEELSLLEKEENRSGESYDRLVSIISQSESRLDHFNKPRYREQAGDLYESLTEEEKLLNELSYSFTESLILLKQISGITVEEGGFFLPDGRQVSGRVIRIGQIAALGIGEDKGGILAPAGGGRFHLIKEEDLGTAEALAGGENPSMLNLFLFESLDHLVENSSKKTLADVIEGGGAIGLVIIGLGIVAVILIVLRSLILSRVINQGDEAHVDKLASLVEEGKLPQAHEYSKELKGATGRVMESTLSGLIHDAEKVEDTIAESVLNEQPALNRFRTAISVFSAVSPLLGLLGTVTGMISTFDIITLYGTGDPKLLSGGISEALVTTELGLIVAIPTLLLGNLLSNWADSINSGLEVSALRMVNASTGFKTSRKKRA